MSDNSKATRERAEARFEKARKAAQEGSKAMAQYENAGVAVREKTARLKALRLAKEAADKEMADIEAAEKPAAKKKPAKSKTAKAV